MKNNLDASVILPVYNQIPALKETLQALSKQYPSPVRFETIVVDDGSSDESGPYLHEAATSLKLHFIQTQNLGPAAARNRGAREAKSDILLFLDADMIPAPGFIQAHLQAQSDHPDTIVEGQRQPWVDARMPHYAKILEIDRNPQRLPIDLTQVLTCNMSLPRQIFWQVGGFDESLKRWQDIDFIYRADQAGIPYMYSPAALAYHNHPIGLDDYCRKQEFHHYQAVALFNKHPDLVRSFPYLANKVPISWKKDPAWRMAQKSIRQVPATRPAIYLMRKVINMLEKAWPSRRMLFYIYWNLIGSYQLRGLRRGIGQFGWPFA